MVKELLRIQQFLKKGFLGLPGLLVWIENISYRPQAYEINGFARIVLEIFAQSDNKIIHRSCRGFAAVSPADFKKPVAGQRLSLVGDEQLEQFDFLFRQMECSLPGMGRGGFKIDPVAAELEISGQR